MQVGSRGRDDRGTAGALVGRMTFRLVVALSLFAVTPAYAQQMPSPAPAAATAADSAAAFDRDLDALFVRGGLTADQAAARAAKASPAVRRNAAEVDAAVARAQAAELARVPQIGGRLSYARLSELDPLLFAPPPAEPFAFPTNSYAAQVQLAVPLSD